MQKTDTTRSPLLQPVIERDYTRGLSQEIKGSGESNQITEPGIKTETKVEPQKPPQQQQQYTAPANDGTKEFSFTDIPSMGEGARPGMGGTGAGSPDISLSSTSAKAFAKFTANAIKVYVPRATYQICKIDMNNVMFNIQKGKLAQHFLATFEQVNKNTEQGLQISEDSLEMWQKAFEEYLKYKNFAFANPETAFWAATITLGTEIALNTYQINKSNKELLREALEYSNPGMFTQQKTTQKTEKTQNNGTGADKIAA